MMAANNRKAVARIAGRSLKANRPRNLIIISAIVLTTLLLTSVFTMAFSINESMQLTKMKTSGGDFHGSFKYLKPEEADRLLQHPAIKEYGKSVLVGFATDDALRGTALEIDQIDENEAKHSFIQFTQGGLPQEENGIAMSTWVLDLLGVPHELGAKVKLDLDIDGRAVSKEFVLSGYYPADRNLSMSGLAFVSEAFVQRNISQIDPERSRLSGSYVNTIRLDVMFGNSWDIEKKLQKVLSDTGLDVPYGVNWAYTSVALNEDPMNVIPLVILILIIMLSGYLLIYNIFHISVVRDIKFYGLLKTIGTTPRQAQKGHFHSSEPVVFGGASGRAGFGLRSRRVAAAAVAALVRWNGDRKFGQPADFSRSRHFCLFDGPDRRQQAGPDGSAGSAGRGGEIFRDRRPWRGPENQTLAAWSQAVQDVVCESVPLQKEAVAHAGLLVVKHYFVQRDLYGHLFV